MLNILEHFTEPSMAKLSRFKINFIPDLLLLYEYSYQAYSTSG